MNMVGKIAVVKKGIYNDEYTNQHLGEKVKVTDRELGNCVFYTGTMLSSGEECGFYGDELEVV